MARMAIVRPREGLTLPMPDGRDLPQDGAPVDIDDLFWMRRIAEGDAIVLAEPASDVDTDTAAPRASKKG